jgi:ribosomal protein L35
MWCWGRMQKISWTDRESKEVLHDVKEERSILHTIKRRKANWTGHNWRRNCLLKHIIKGKTEGKRRRGRRGKQVLDDLMEKEVLLLHYIC